MMPAISVIIPLRDGARYVTAALDSIAQQTMPVERVIVVDDGSTDAGPAIAAEHRLRPAVVPIPPSGIGAARNHGLVLARTEFVAFLDCDDLWPSDHCEVLIRALADDASLSMAFGHAEQFVSPDVSPELAAALHVPSTPQPGLSAGAMMARRAVFDRVGLFRADLRVAEFISWLLLAGHLGERHVVLPDTVLLRRHHATNIGRHRGDDRRLDYVRAIRDHLTRRRSAPGGEPGA